MTPTCTGTVLFLDTLIEMCNHVRELLCSGDWMLVRRAAHVNRAVLAFLRRLDVTPTDEVFDVSHGESHQTTDSPVAESRETSPIARPSGRKI